MDLKKLQTLVVKALENVKAQDISIFDTTHLTSLFDRVVIASGTSNRHTKALASSVRDTVKEAGGYVGNIEGEGTGEWVLIDLGDIVVHVMQPVIRGYYRLEEIWGDKPVKITVAPKKRLVTAEVTTTPKPKKTAVAAQKNIKKEAPKAATTKTTPVKKATRATPKVVKAPVVGAKKISVKRTPRSKAD